MLAQGFFRGRGTGRIIAPAASLPLDLPNLEVPVSLFGRPALPAGRRFMRAARAMCTTLAVAMVAAPALAQSRTTISGTVTETRSGTPLASVTVTIPGTRHAALSGDGGRYVLSGVPAGIHAIE